MKSAKTAPANAAVRIPSPRGGHFRLWLPALFEPPHHPSEPADALSRFGVELFLSSSEILPSRGQKG
jgi:hypothetical protein